MLTDLVKALLGRIKTPGRPALIGIGGAQGAGKSTLAAAFAEAGDVAQFSLDDVYLTKAEREALAQRHPLWRTRGPPGTHDLDLARRTIAALFAADEPSRTPLPAFDKLADDRAPSGTWPVFAGRPRVVLVEGWCMGAAADAADGEAPVNALEAEEDADGVWRAGQRAALAGAYADFFAQFDAIVQLQAPSFDIVRVWRGEQEARLRGRALTAAENAALDRFVHHYERITRAMLAGRCRADAVVELNEKRDVMGVRF